MLKTKNFSIFLMIVFLATFSAGCSNKDNQSSADSKQTTKEYLSTDIGPNICKEFTADFVYSATGKPIVKMEPPVITTVFACDYYTDYKNDFYEGYNGSPRLPGGPSIHIVLDNLNVEKHKKDVQTLGLKVETSPKISMDNFVVRRSKDNSIWEVGMALTENRYIWTNTLNKALTDDELIDFAAKIAEKIQGKLSFEIKSNPVAIEDPTKAGVSQEKVVTDFLSLLSNKKFDEAINMMDANAETKQGWKTNFNYLDSVKVNKTEEVYKEEWTASRQVFKVELDVKIKSGGEQVGWENGTNFRWISLQKNGEVWQIHEIANNP